MGKGGYNGGSTVIHAGSGWFGRSSATPHSKKKKSKKEIPSIANSKRKKKVHKRRPSIPRKGNGLTIPQKIAKAEQKVQRIEGEIVKTKKQLATLNHELNRALTEVDRARNLPRRSALGSALHKAIMAESLPSPDASQNKNDNLTNSEHKASKSFRNNSKFVVEQGADGKHIRK